MILISHMFVNCLNFAVIYFKRSRYNAASEQQRRRGFNTLEKLLFLHDLCASVANAKKRCTQNTAKVTAKVLRSLTRFRFRPYGMLKYGALYAGASVHILGGFGKLQRGEKTLLGGFDSRHVFNARKVLN